MSIVEIVDFTVIVALLALVWFALARRTLRGAD